MRQQEAQEAPGDTQEAPGDTQEAPGGTQEAPRRHPGGTRRHPGGTQEEAPGGTQEAPRRPGGTQEARGDLEARRLILYCKNGVKVEWATISRRRNERECHRCTLFTRL